MTAHHKENQPRPLEGFRVVECGIWHAGPGSSAILADLGYGAGEITGFKQAGIIK